MSRIRFILSLSILTVLGLGTVAQAGNHPTGPVIFPGTNPKPPLPELPGPSSPPPTSPGTTTFRDSAGNALRSILNEGGLIQPSPGQSLTPLAIQQNVNVNTLLQPQSPPISRSAARSILRQQSVPYSMDNQTVQQGIVNPQGARSRSAQINGIPITSEVTAVLTGNPVVAFPETLITPIPPTSPVAVAPPRFNPDIVVAYAGQLTTAVQGLAAPNHNPTIAEVNDSITAYNNLIVFMGLEDPNQLAYFPHLHSLGAILTTLRSSIS